MDLYPDKNELEISSLNPLYAYKSTIRIIIISMAGMMKKLDFIACIIGKTDIVNLIK